MIRANRHLLRSLVNNLIWGLSGVGPPKTVSSLSQWVGENPSRGSIDSISSADHITFPPLKTALGQTVTERPNALDVNARWVGTLEQGRVAGKHGAVITCDNQLVADVSGFIGNGQQSHPLMRSGKLPRPMDVRGSVAVIASLGSYTYYHWLLDAVPRFGVLEEGGADVDYCYVPRNGRFHDEALELLGFPQERLIAASRLAHVRARQLIVPSIPSSRQFAPPMAIEFLRERFLPHGATKSLPQRFYITRRNARWRRVLNEPQIIDLLNRHHYEVVDPSRMSLREQIGLFARAEAIIAPHGAGLANCVFCSPRTKVLELSTPLRPLHCFYHLCHQLDLDYEIFMAEGVQPNRSREDSQLHVDVKQLRSALAIAEMN